MASEIFDLAVIGAGSAGLTAARFAAKLGAKVALIEKARIGGDCTWTGCVPSKALIRAAKVAHDVRSAGKFGMDCAPPRTDMRAVRDYVQDAVQQAYREEKPDLLRSEGIHVFEGSARFLDRETISAGNVSVRARKFLIATGARAAIPPIAGLADTPFLTYERIFENETLPESMLVVGAGPVGMEIAQAYSRLGSRVTILAESVLPKDDPEAVAMVRRELERDGVRFLTGKAKSARAAAGKVILEAGAVQTEAAVLFLACGRTPNVDGLNLDRIGVKYSAAGINVDRHLRTSVRNIYAAGDVTGGRQFTHYAGWQAFQAARNALLPGAAEGIRDSVPWVTFTDPELAQAGLTEQQARARFGDRLQIARRGPPSSDRAICEGDPDSFLKIIAEPNGTVVGATAVGSRAGEMIGELNLAIANRMRIQDLAGTIHPYPTYATAIQQLAADMAVTSSLSGLRGRAIRAILRWKK